MKTFLFEVERVTGPCACGYQKGDVIQCRGLQTPDVPFCGGAYMALFPIQAALHSGGAFSLEGNPGSQGNLACPDHGYVTFKITMVEGPAREGAGFTGEKND